MWMWMWMWMWKWMWMRECRRSYVVWRGTKQSLSGRMSLKKPLKNLSNTLPKNLSQWMWMWIGMRKHYRNNASRKIAPHYVKCECEGGGGCCGCGCECECVNVVGCSSYDVGLNKHLVRRDCPKTFQKPCKHPLKQPVPKTSFTFDESPMRKNQPTH